MVDRKKLQLDLDNTDLIPQRSGAAPLVLKVVETHQSEMMEGYVPATLTKNEMYIKLSALPQDMQQKIVTMIKTLQGYR